MLVYFSANARDMDSYESYRSIIKAIQNEGGILVHGWIETSALRGGMPSSVGEWWDSMPSEALLGVKDADVVIVEATGQSSLGVGHEMTMALSWNKPVLALIDKGFDGGSYIQGVRHPFLKVAYYDRQNLTQIVRVFLKHENRGGVNE